MTDLPHPGDARPDVPAPAGWAPERAALAGLCADADPIAALQAQPAAPWDAMAARYGETTC